MSAKKEISNVHQTITVRELYRRHPNISWIPFLNGVIGISDYVVSYEDQVVVRSPQYVAELEYLIRWTSKR